MKVLVQTRVILIVLVAAVLYAVGVEPYWIETTFHRPVPINGDGSIRIAQLSDLHLRKIGMREESVITELQRLKPDLIVLSGDVIDQPESIDALVEFLEKLPRAEMVVILGNWEYWGNINLQSLRQAYESHGVRLLVNEEHRYVLKGKKIRIVGLDDFTAGKPKVVEAEPKSDEEIYLLVQHSPGFFESEQAKAGGGSKGLNFCLSGHTHAGQVTLFGWPIWVPPGSGSFIAGWHRTALCDLYVARGVGTSLLPARFFARPEIAVFDL